MTDTPSADYPLTTLRTTVPAVGKAIPTDRRGAIQGAPHRGRQIAWALAAVVAVAVAAFLSWFAFLSPVTVSVAPVQSNVRQQVFGLGTVGARVQSNVGFKVAGVLAALDADQGDRVRAGQVLARLDARDIEAQVAVAKAAVAQATCQSRKGKGRCRERRRQSRQCQGDSRPPAGPRCERVQIRRRSADDRRPRPRRRR